MQPSPDYGATAAARMEWFSDGALPAVTFQNLLFISGKRAFMKRIYILPLMIFLQVFAHTVRAQTGEDAARQFRLQQKEIERQQKEKNRAEEQEKKRLVERIEAERRAMQQKEKESRKKAKADALEEKKAAKRRAKEEENKQASTSATQGDDKAQEPSAPKNLPPPGFVVSERTKLSAAINSEADEVGPIWSSDGSTLWFTRGNCAQNKGGKSGGQDVWVSKWNGKEWSKARNLGSPINNRQHNALGGSCKSGNLYLTNQYGNPRPGISMFRSQANAQPELIFSEDQIPSEGTLSFYVTPDERVMILAFQTVKDEEDLFISFNQNGQWTTPRNLGKTLNTPSPETAPYLSPDGQLLFFSSSGRGGMGQADVFVSRRLDDRYERWSTPRNLGGLVNTSGYDGYAAMSSDGATLLFGSGDAETASLDVFAVPTQLLPLPKPIDTLRLETVSGERIASRLVDLYPPAGAKAVWRGAASRHSGSLMESSEQPDFVDYIPAPGFVGSDTLLAAYALNRQAPNDSLVVLVTVKPRLTKVTLSAVNAQTNELIPDVEWVVSTTQGQKEIEQKKNAQGLTELTLELPAGFNLKANAKGFFPVDLVQQLTANGPLKQNLSIPFTPLTKGSTITLRNILFETGKARLKSESDETLGQVLEMLRTNQKVRVMIIGHTDNVGKAASNKALSTRRVESVIEYLVQKGISRNRLEAKGKGSSEPLADNATEEGRQLNRRVELKVLGDR
jgi:outer membrane protein OmpA-like peptidoglycan-associated protein